MSKSASLSLAFLASVFALPQAWADDEPAIEGDEAALPYLKAVHAKVHTLWADNFLLLAASQLPKDHAINVPSRRVELDVVISAKGALLDVWVGKSSGSTEFDASAMETLRAAGELPLAPEAVLSDDGKAHLRWALARDDRRCSGLAVTRHDLPVVEAVRALVGQGRDKLAIARLQAVDDSERMAGMDALARAWLDRKENDDDLALLVAMANAQAGDDRGAQRLRQALARPDQEDVVAELAVRGLAALKIPVCPLFKESLGKMKAVDGAKPGAGAKEPDDETFVRMIQSRQARHRLLWALTSASADGDCLAFIIATAKDRAAKPSDRTLALLSLANSDAPEARAVLRALAKDPEPKIQAQAILSEAQPSAGRGAVFRLIPLLRDKSAAVRAAAAAALVRVGGEDVLPQLFQIYREKDPTIFVGLAAELSTLSGAASAEMLGRLLKKDSRVIRVAAARALAARRDEHAAKLQATLTAAVGPELQLLSGLALPKEKRDAAVRAKIDDNFDASYQSLLRGSARVVAADWLLVQFTTLHPQAQVFHLGEWMATRPKPP